MLSRVRAAATLLAAALFLSVSSFAAGNIFILNADPAGVGFNDPTPVAPIGGNPGTTLGAQRVNVYLAAADAWQSSLPNGVDIYVVASWPELPCTPTSATLGSAGAISVWRDFPNAPRPNTWYGAALANKLAGTDLSSPDFNDVNSFEIRARFNVNLGNANCLAGSPFYLGFDANHGDGIDFYAALLHELGHGIGFQTFTDGSTGAFVNDGTNAEGYPSIWDYYLYDATLNKHWNEETAAQRAASALSVKNLRWDGPLVKAAAPEVLQLGNPQLTVSLPVSAAGTFPVGTASFGPALSNPGVTAEIMPVAESSPGQGAACSPLSAANAAAVNGKIALVDRGACNFDVKVKNCQNAGAVAVLIADNAVGSPPAGLGGSDDTITIPAVRISVNDGNNLKAALAGHSRTHSGMFANLGVNTTVYSGADSAGRVLMFAPTPFIGGSSVSHYDVSAFPNLLMEPDISGDLTHNVAAPFDLTFELLKDIGWTP